MAPLERPKGRRLAKSAPISPTRHAAPRAATAPQAPPSMPPPRKQTPLSYFVSVRSPWILLVGRFAPLERPTGRRLAKICTNQPETPRRSSCCDCPPSTAIDAAAAETSPTELSRVPAKPVDAVGGLLGTLGAPQGPPPGNNLHQSARQATPLLVLRLPPSTAIDAAAAETSPTELSHAPAKPVDAVGGPLGTLGASRGPLPGQNLHQAARHATPLLVLRLPPRIWSTRRVEGAGAAAMMPAMFRVNSRRRWRWRPQPSATAGRGTGQC